MRQALTGLTARGRTVVAAGLIVALVALVLGEHDLLQVSVFLIALPVLAAFLVGRTQFRLSCRRVLTPPRVSVGDRAEVSLTLTNLSRVPTGLLLIEETLPHSLGERPRFVVDRIGGHEHQVVSYTVRGGLRGRFRVGPVQLRLTDPFGLVELTRRFASTERLTVTPTVHPVPPVGLGGAWSGGGDSSARSVSVQGDEDAATREYRSGDDLRKVHWRSTARIGKLMVRREEQPWQTRASLLIDLRVARHRGEGPAASLEWAISTAASLGVHLGRLGYALRLFTDGGERQTGTDGDFSTGHLLLDELALVTSSASTDLSQGVQAVRQAAEEGLLVAVLADVDPEEVQSLAAGRSGSARGIAVLLDVSTWMTSGDRAAMASRHRAAVAVLRHAGWRVVVGSRGATITEAWAQAAVSAFAAVDGRESHGVLPTEPVRPGQPRHNIEGERVAT
ncbi:MAG: DUF58 domain-containing protein [Geodermatophilaceae bacterium]|nr:DUF58 domain-containing protein [Geodermatophilaceae bacterium]